MRRFLSIAICGMFAPVLGLVCGEVFAASPAPAPTESIAKVVPAASDSQDSLPPIEIQNPLDETLFPPEMPPPRFRWKDVQPGVDAWLVILEFAGVTNRLRFQVPDGSEKLTPGSGRRDSEIQVRAGSAPVEKTTQSLLTPAPATRGDSPTLQWMPTPETWKLIQSRSVGHFAKLTILGFNPRNPERALSRGVVTFATSADEVGASLFYREVNLPFEEAVKDPSQIRWRYGSIASSGPPPVVMQNLPVCGNCHSFSRDGRVFGMDVDYANSKGSYAVTEVRPRMTLTSRDIFTWDDYRREDGELTFGLLSQVSPDGRRVISTVKDKSVFVARPDLAFSQLFFPIKGILAVYDRATRTFASLPGADDPEYVQSNPVWSPDGRHVIFARTRAYDMKDAVGQGRVLLTPEECREFLKDGRPFRYDLYRVPYNEGRGGKAEPLAGASDNGLSNYFPRYSPDGRWVVFCRSANYMLLQPDSELFIIPAAGGTPRRLRANTSRMNSWHSWSPNSRWLVFSSKAHSPFTQLFLTHIDDEGESTPPVSLAHLTAPDRAANIPEFVPLPPDAMVQIQEQFLDDYSFERAGNEFYRGGEPDRAIDRYRQALKLNPGNANAHQRLGFLLFNVKRQFDEGLAHTTEALRLAPTNGLAHCDLGMAMLNRGQAAQATAHLLAALESVALTTDAHYKPQAIRFYLGQALVQQSRFREASVHLEESARLDPGNADVQYLLALALAGQGQIEPSVQRYTQAVGLKPGIDSSVALHEMLSLNYARAGRLAEAIRSAEHALELARASGKDTLAERVAARLRQYRERSAKSPN